MWRGTSFHQALKLLHQAAAKGTGALAACGSTFMLILKAMLQTYLQATATALAGIREGEFLSTALHRTPWLRLHTRSTCATRHMAVEDVHGGLLILCVAGEGHVTERAHDHTPVLGRVAMGTLVSVILEVLSTEGLATSITFERKHVLLLAVRIRAMLSTVAEVRHVLCPNCVERSTQQGRSESLEAKTPNCIKTFGENLFDPQHFVRHESYNRVAVKFHRYSCDAQVSRQPEFTAQFYVKGSLDHFFTGSRNF